MSKIMLEETLTKQIIGVFYKVYNALGYGFLEKVYENAMAIELRKVGLSIECQKQIKVHYDGELIGDYYADIVVNNIVILELKAAESLHPAHEAQLLNYLKATEKEIGLLFNFGEKPQFRRYFSNDKKKLRVGSEDN